MKLDSNETVLEQLRQKISSFPEAPSGFLFCSNGISISRVQEKFMLASDLLPMCTIVEDMADGGKDEEISLAQKITEVQMENEKLRYEVKELKKELEDTKKELEEKDELFALLKKKMGKSKEKAKGKDEDEDYVELQ